MYMLAMFPYMVLGFKSFVSVFMFGSNVVPEAGHAHWLHSIQHCTDSQGNHIYNVNTSLLSKY